ncbi:MAG: GTPase ObgE [Planctomycetes bacterium]|nr:GTPase ObgE [Planctomycetota bacterium]
MFVDRVTIEAQAGKGGDGAISFLRESGKPKGGPDGGDGGDGGSVILHVSPARMTLQDIGHRRHYRAPPGQNGRGKNMAGRGGRDLVITVPPGTLVFDDEAGALVADLTDPGTDFVLCRGGRGGRGNTSFANALNQVPRVATRGEPGQRGKFRFELKLIAEVGIVGLPNAGKSTFLSRVSRATPKIAAYPFTTLHPHLGVATELGVGRELVLADIPGLIEGASQGKGLGDDFLRHVERTRVLLHLVDGTSTGEPDSGGPAPLDAYRTIRAELAAYGDGALAHKPEVVALNKVDALAPDEAEARARALSAAIERPVLLVSGVSGHGTRQVLETLRATVDAQPPAPPEDSSVLPP